MADHRTRRQLELDELRERQADDLFFLEVDVDRLGVEPPMPPASPRAREVLELELRRVADIFRADDVEAAIEAARPSVAGRLAQRYIAETRHRRDPNYGDPARRAERHFDVSYLADMAPEVRNDVYPYAFFVALADHVAAFTGK